VKLKYLAWAIPMLFSSVSIHAQDWQENQKDVAGPSGSSSSAAQQVAQNAAPQNGSQQNTGAANSGSADVGRITVEGQSPGAGLIQQEESPKARSSVTKEAIDRVNPSSNPYQAMNLMPGVSTSSQDATGLFGGSLRVRGFNSDQMGVTLDGVPVNDSGAFTVFPNEYIDIENLQEIFLTQGSADNEAPHVGATGGNIGLNIVRPRDVAGANVNQSIGDLHYTRTFARLDTGLIDDRYKAFISFSHTEAYKFRGQGEANRDHIDFNGVIKLAPQSSISAGFYFNDQINNSFRPLTKLQSEQDYFQDYGSTPVHHVAAGTDVIPVNNFYGLELNPFVNYTATVKGNFQLTPNLRLDVEPYYTYGYGGAVFPTTLKESSTGLHGGVADINGNGNRTDTVEILRGSITETFRPGFTTKLTYQLDNHRLVGGFWMERSRQAQTGPALRIDNNGNAASSIWMDDTSQLVRYNDGTPDQSRNAYTVTTGKSVFLQDTATFFNDKLTVQPGIKHIGAHRDFQNYASDTNFGGADYHLSEDYYKTLSSLGLKYQFTPAHSSFINVAQNFKIPGNFSYTGLLLSNPTFVNGVAVGQTPIHNPPGVPETSINLDVGYRYAGERLTASATMFDVEFHNRLA
jgi:iron complex outermembrane receptor protein